MTNLLYWKALANSNFNRAKSDFVIPQPKQSIPVKLLKTQIVSFDSNQLSETKGKNKGKNKMINSM